MTTWLLLRGLTREAGHWGDFPALLQAALPGSVIEAIDLPGAGSRNAIASPLRIEEIAEQCRSQALARGLRPPFNILALSMGAMVAVAWADRHPDDVAACVLLNTSLRGLNPIHHRLRIANLPTLLRLALPATMRRREAAIFRLTSNSVARRQAIIDDWVAVRRARPVSTGNALRQLIAAARYRGPLRPPRMPMLVLASRGDALVNPECSRRLASAWHTEYAEHPSAGHDLPLDDGAWVVARVAGWWRPHDRTPSPL